jgi:hypothetical protein
MASEQTNKYAEMEKAFKLYKQGFEVPDKVPAGWITCKDFSEKYKIAICTSNRFFKKLLKQNKAEQKKFRIKLNERVQPICHYKLCNPTKKTR